MDAARRFLAIVGADFRERSRQTRFWIMLAVMGLGAWWFFPAADAGYLTVAIGDARGLYSSAWVGMVLGMMFGTIVALFGFYVVRGTLARDFETRVWELLVATPMTRAGYLLAKWSSHMLVLSLLAAVALAVGAAAQWHHAEVAAFAPWELVKPMLVFAVPAMAVTAVFAILFDLLPWLRRSGGNALYFVVWIFVFISLNERLDPESSAWAAQTWLSDPGGMAMAMRDIRGQLATVAPGLETQGFSIGVNMQQAGVATFEWTTWTPSLADLAGRGLWIAASLLAVLAMAPMLDWAAARSEARQPGQRSTPGFRLRWLDAVLRPFEWLPVGRLFAAEAKLVLRQRRLTWWLALAVLWIVQASAPEKGQAIAAILAWLACLDIFARAALREHETGTSALVFSASGARHRVLAARLALAVGLALVVALPALLRSSGEATLALLLVAATVAVAGLASAALLRSPRPFELALVFLAYIGVQGDPTLNAFAEPAVAMARHAWLLPVSLVLLMVAWPLAARRT